MNDPMNSTPPPFVTATLLGKLNDQPVNWGFPVVTGTSRDIVQAEIRSRCTGEFAGLMHDPSTQIIYPGGPWAGNLTADNPPIGMRPPVPPSVPPVPPAERAPKPPQGGSGTAPPQRRQGAEEDLGPLPSDRGPPQTEQAALSDLEDVLMQWRRRHNVTSAEFFAYVHRIMAFYAGQLVTRERQPRR